MANLKRLKEVGQGLARLTAARKGSYRIAATLLVCLLVIFIGDEAIEAQPTLVDPRLDVRTVVSGLNSPTTMAFLGEDDILVLEKETGRVRRVMNGAIQSTVLDLPVNFGSERGLLGIALHPEFPTNPGVYLFWTESTTGNDTSVLSETPLLGNRVDRFTWDGSTLTVGENIIRLRAIQQDATNPVERGNHDGGMLRFGPDGKLYIFFGDQGRRGQLQNLPDGPFGPGQPDDQFGGPEPDNAHLSGVILRLNDDGTPPADNPFFNFGASVGGEVGANIQKIFSYGHRNSFGMAFDPFSGKLWLQENGDDSFTELNLVEAGMNGGWVQIAGPVERIAQFKQIETSTAIDPIKMSVYFGLQQERWPPTLIADTPAEALTRLFMLPGAHYSDPKLSWKFEVAPAGIGFLASVALGPRYEGDLFLGEARTFLDAGYLFRLRLNRTRREIAVRDSALEDKVADNLNAFDITESETLLFGRGFGVGTDIQTGPNGNLFVVSLSNGAIYEIFHSRRP
jgi:glucose/arabinose dehydrogenase